MSNLVWRVNPAARPLMVACTLLALQGLALVALAGIGLWAAITMDAQATGLRGDRALVVGLAIMALLGAVLAGALCRALARGRGWARGPLITLEIVTALAGMSSWGSGPQWIAFALLIPAVVILVVLLLPAVVAATTAESRRRGAYPED